MRIVDVCPACGREAPEDEAIIVLSLEREPEAPCWNCGVSERRGGPLRRTVAPGCMPEWTTLAGQTTGSWEATARAPWKATITGWGVLLLVGVLFVPNLIRGPREVSVKITLAILCVAAVFAVAEQALRTWGRYVISGTSEGFQVFRGIGRLGRTRAVRWSELAGVWIRTTYGARGSQSRAVYVAAGGGFGFGRDLSDQQRYFLADLLLAKCKDAS